MSSTTLWAFWAFSMIFVVIPGPDWAYAIAAGVRGRGVMAAVFGLLVGYLALTLAVATGFAVLGASSSAFITGLTVVGALYLGWLGIGLLQNPPVPQAGASDADGVSRTGQFLRGTLVSGLNPKGLLFFLAFVPPWTSAQASWSVPVQIAALGLVYTASCAVVYSMVGLGASAALKTRPAAARMMGRLSGGVMVVLAVVLVGELFWV
ncbi:MULTISPECIES: LysE family translocator [unclassified Pseudomonas]|uniref:LysE family translocator n=1 Tax=unclassified Pseudomonas TaxID=196821 RepID=UPI000BA4E568|nr:MULTISPECIES: LysE family translocator [unclassified Pseudomonas]MCU1734493.1 LysE family translocator [Pseudomonas sp. 20P_3.2_Bac4]MCU1745530.1 LysE family translocator [Pseudomonas sp. 20P_3.2_Bac5]